MKYCHLYRLVLLLLTVCGSCAARDPHASDSGTTTRRVRVINLPAGAPATPSQTLSDDELAEVSRRIVQQTNRFRREQGRPEVRPERAMQNVASNFARYMATTNRYGHNADSRTPAERAKAGGYDYCLIAENIAYQYSSAGFAPEELSRAFAQGWIDSPPHRKNMIDPDVTETAVAVARSKNGTYYAVQLFGRPEKLRIDFKIINESGRNIDYTLDGQQYNLPPQSTRTHGVCRPPQLHFDGIENADRLTPTDESTYIIRLSGNQLRIN